jgi:hypothetical protein
MDLPNTYCTKCGSTDTKKFFRPRGQSPRLYGQTPLLANKLATCWPTSSCLVHQTRTSCTTCWLINSTEPTCWPTCWALARPAPNKLYTCWALVLPEPNKFVGDVRTTSWPTCSYSGVWPIPPGYATGVGIAAGGPCRSRRLITRRDVERRRRETADYRRRSFSGFRGGAPTANALCI